MLWMLLTAMTLLGMAAPEPSPEPSTPNRWAEPTRGILAQHCGQCHLPNLPTSVPRALAVFNLTDETWYGGLTRDQLDSLVLRVSAIKELPAADRSIVDRFVRCAGDRDCPAGDP